MSKIKLKYIHQFVDRRYGGATARFYFRRPGCKRVPLPGLPGSPEFMDRYTNALADSPKIEIGAKRVAAGSLGAAVTGYLGSVAFTNLAGDSQRSRRLILERLREKHGDKPIAGLGRHHIVKLIEAKAGKPGAALNLLAALRALLRCAVSVGLRTDDPTIGVRGPKLRKGGFYCWGEQDIAAFEARHPVGSQARLALALLLYSAQRRADVIKLGRQHIRNGVLHVTQSKTGTSLAIPVHPELRAVIDATPGDHLTFLTSQGGRPFHPDAFTHWFRKRCVEAGLPINASVHGLRKAACRRMAEAGRSEKQIASVSGHKSLPEVARYTEAADQARLAEQAVEGLTRTSSGNRSR